jgi:hypothetical protein
MYGDIDDMAGQTWLVKAGDTDWREVHEALDAVR